MLSCSKSLTVPVYRERERETDTISPRYRAKRNGSFCCAPKYLCLCVFVFGEPCLLLPSVELELGLTPFLAHFENPWDNGCNDKAGKICRYCLSFFFFSCFLLFLLFLSTYVWNVQMFWSWWDQSRLCETFKWKWCLCCLSCVSASVSTIIFHWKKKKLSNCSSHLNDSASLYLVCKVLLLYCYWSQI